MKTYIDQKELYETTDGGKSVFQHYFPDCPFGSKKTHVSIRTDDKTPSALISLYNDLWRITDFGNQQEVNSMPAIQFVKWREGLEFVDALHFFQEVILGLEVNGKAFKKPNQFTYGALFSISCRLIPIIYTEIKP